MNVTKRIGENCCGCGVCTLCCPAGLELARDKDGYYKSRIDQAECLDCGRCLSVCPQGQPADTVDAPSFVVCGRDGRDALGSSSGGLAHVIARRYLRQGYAVVGAAWSRDFKRVEHIVVRDEAELERLRKTKYVQSFTPDAFAQIGKLDKAVVFGTPCQIAGLRNLCGNKPGLILVDFDCMGPAGLGLWEKYLAFLHRFNGSGIRSLRMRDKKKSWMVYGTDVVFEDGTEYFADKFHDPFCVLYHLARTIQSGCLSNCGYLNRSKADLRVGDAWNYTDGFTRKQIHDGLSIATPLTDRGREVLRAIDGEIVVKSAERIPNKRTHSEADAKLWDRLRDPAASIEDAVAVYNDVGLRKRVSRKLSTALSSHDTVYLLVKRLLKSYRSRAKGQNGKEGKEP